MRRVDSEVGRVAPYAAVVAALAAPGSEFVAALGFGCDGKL